MTVTRRRSPRGSGEQLRPEIVAAAKDLMAAAGTSEEVSIRAVATAVGVSAPSIYLHFADKQELISAVVLDVFEALDREMVAAGTEAVTPIDRLLAYGLAYVRFGLEHPEHYRIATMDPCPRPDVDTMLAEGAFVHFRSAVEACMEAGDLAQGDSVSVTIELWSAAHGITALLIAKPELPVDDPIAIAERVLVAAALGHARQD
ncbi:MAG: TetR/AcrR family transcriptional regulator [Marmoricola sp.]